MRAPCILLNAVQHSLPLEPNSAINTLTPCPPSRGSYHDPKHIHETMGNAWPKSEALEGEEAINALESLPIGLKTCFSFARHKQHIDCFSLQQEAPNMAQNSPLRRALFNGLNQKPLRERKAINASENIHFGLDNMIFFLIDTIKTLAFYSPSQGS